jgi:hypothetical protein
MPRGLGVDRMEDLGELTRLFIINVLEQVERVFEGVENARSRDTPHLIVYKRKPPFGNSMFRVKPTWSLFMASDGQVEPRPLARAACGPLAEERSCPLYFNIVNRCFAWAGSSSK